MDNMTDNQRRMDLYKSWEKETIKNEEITKKFLIRAEDQMHNKNIKYVEDMSSAELQKIFPEYDPSYNYNIDEENLDNYDSSIIDERLTRAFETTIYKLYAYLSIKNPDYTWYQLVREFIRWHENNKYSDLHTLFNMNPYLYFEKITSSSKKMCEIQEKGFQMFVGEKCANIDEDEFDSENDLNTYEWEAVDDIILYHYLCNL